jgi:ATP-dependent DNA helicase Q1
VISPLVALIQDQVYSLKEIGIEAFSLTATTSKEDTKQIMDLLAGKCKDQPKHALVYVTPERISQSKRFMAQLEKCYTGERLARIVIDECHCCSQLGHDFRPDYKKLGVLRTLFPRAPIVALTATCPPNVQASVIDILNLKPIGKGGTLLFEAPLERRLDHGYKLVDLTLYIRT